MDNLVSCNDVRVSCKKNPAFPVENFVSRRDVCVSRKKSLVFRKMIRFPRKDLRVSRNKNPAFRMKNLVSRRDVRVVSLLRFLNWVLLFVSS